MAALKQVEIPDLGNVANVDVIEVNVAVGDKVSAEDTLITLEGDKATMEIPSPYSGIVKELKINVGDKVSAGKVILSLETQDNDSEKQKNEESVFGLDPADKPRDDSVEATGLSSRGLSAGSSPKHTSFLVENEDTIVGYQESGIAVHAGPAVRRLARELGVDLERLAGSGPKARILKEDIQAYVKAQLAQVAIGGGFAIPQPVAIDFAQFGAIETTPLSRIKRLTGTNMSRNWISIPHVTQFAEADITELEAFRQANKQDVEQNGVKLTPLAFIIKAVVTCLKKYPHFNASLSPTGEQLILKKYYHIGIAIDTQQGLVVAVIRDVDRKSVVELAVEMAQISQKARTKGLTVAEMQGSSFTVSSLGGIGGGHFTPIVNAPDVAILGVSKASIQPVHINEEFKPRLILPLALSYDHRVIDGAEGARFATYLTELLSDVRRLLL